MSLKKTLFLKVPARTASGLGAAGAMEPEDYEHSRRSLLYLILVVALLFGFLILRLWFLQLVKGHEFSQKSESNRVRYRDIPPWRGMIFDARGVVLVNNRESYDALVILEDVPDAKELARNLGQLLKMNYLDILTRILTAQQDNLARTIRIKEDLSLDELALLETFKYELPGVIIQIQPKREYLTSNLGSHLIGYLGEITEAQLKSGKFPSNRMGDDVGKCGVELGYNAYLTGQRGSQQIEVDAHGRQLRLLNNTPASPGANVFLTIDWRLQTKAEELLQGKVGAIVAMDPQSGRILAMASAPTFDQSRFARRVSAEYWRELMQNPDHPLENRVLKGQYPPGSTFKIIMAVAALEEGIVNPSTTFLCRGGLQVGNRYFKCHASHGNVSLHRSLVQSCDVYYYNVGLRLGVDRIAKWSRKFGLGAPTGITLDSEKAGLVPSSEWKKKRFNQPWHEGETASVSIGQGYNLTTPLQMVRVAAALGNGGIIYTPTVVEKIVTPDGEVAYQFTPQIQSRLDASPKTLELVRRACRGVVHEGGTGTAARIPYTDVGGKTGTAQVVSLGKEGKGKNRRKTQDHAWFVSFAPVEKSQIAVAVIIEHGGHGGATAAPVAREVMSEFFRLQQEEDKKSEQDG
ncbi:MAG: penicillin-binding protein 2 [Desulfobacca sp.]|uniref:penicillin-binding protein 2 n=1 Tax=Desulfobacca sp. TaxID=2067990 RepID=UPI00404ABACE